MTVAELQSHNSRQVVAANVRARMGWLDMSPPDLARLLGCSVRTAYNKRAGITSFSPEDLDRLAKKFEMATPAPLYEVPPSFPLIPRTEPAEQPAMLSARQRRSSGRSPSAGSGSSPRRSGCSPDRFAEAA